MELDAYVHLGVIIQLFEWTWPSIAVECTQFIGPAGTCSVVARNKRIILLIVLMLPGLFNSSLGYGAVQVSPPTEHITGSQWWTDYQVVYVMNSTYPLHRSPFVNPEFS